VLPGAQNGVVVVDVVVDVVVVVVGRAVVGNTQVPVEQLPPGQVTPQEPQFEVVVLDVQLPPQQILFEPQEVLFGAGAKPQSPPAEHVATWQELAAGCGQLLGPVHGAMQPWVGSRTVPDGQLGVPVQYRGGMQRLLMIVSVMELYQVQQTQPGLQMPGLLTQNALPQ
jgi:hypothetical protein